MSRSQVGYRPRGLYKAAMAMERELIIVPGRWVFLVDASRPWLPLPASLAEGKARDPTSHPHPPHIPVWLGQLIAVGHEAVWQVGNGHQVVHKEA